MRGIYHAADSFLATYKHSSSRIDWDSMRTAAQRKVRADKSRRKCYLAGRRAGKTHEIALEMLECADTYPGEMSLYLTLTKEHSARNLRKPIDKVAKQSGIKIDWSEQNGQLRGVHPNGHTIWLAGCKDKTEAEKYRGDFYRLVILDEAGSWRFEVIEWLCKDVLAPALSDVKGTLVISGSPGAIPEGFFWERSTGDGEVQQWSTHTWTVLENEHHPAGRDPEALWEELKLDGHVDDEWFEKVGTKLGIRPSDIRITDHRVQRELPITVQREWFAKWVLDTDALVYPFNRERNSFHGELPQGRWHYVLSFDLGHNDHTTFTVSASRYGFPEVYFLTSYGFPEMTTVRRVGEIERLRKIYPIDRIVGDLGALGKAMGEDMRTIYGIPVEPADKQAKASAIRNLADGIRRGTVLVAVGGHPMVGLAGAPPFGCEQLISEWKVLPWGAERTDHHPDFKDDCSDGALYGYRAHRIREQWEREKPLPGTPEAINAEAEAYRKKLANRGKKRGSTSLDRFG